MESQPPSPLQISHPQRRAALSRHFLAVVEPLLEAGEEYSDLSVERLIKTANISRSSFYVYFEDKGDLLRAMAQDMVEDIAVQGDAWWEFPPNGDREQLRAALMPAIEAFRGHKLIFRAVLAAASYDAAVRDQRNGLVNQTAARLAQHIRAGQRDGTIAPDVDPERTAAWLVRMLEAGLDDLVSPASEPEAQRLIDALTDIMWRTLYEGYR